MKGLRFKPEMAVAALRPINPKLETRRLIRTQPPTGYDSRCEANDGNVCWENSVQQVWPDAWEGLPCDYKVGERRCLLTRWAVSAGWDDTKPTDIIAPALFWHAGMGPKPEWAGKSRPGMFLPIHLRHVMPVFEVTSVRAERLSTITPDGAKREGLSCSTKDFGRTLKYGIADYDGLPGTDDLGWPWKDWNSDPVAAYRTLWEKINGNGSWDENPWVWVIGFKRVQP